MKKNIIVLKNQGFCYGVVRACELCNNNLDQMEKPIYFLGNLVHNKKVNDYFKEKGIVILNDLTRMEMLNNINKGTVVLTAHGVGSNVYQKLKEKNLNFLDTTCPFVLRASKLIHEHLNKGYSILYIGKNHHPEAEGVLSESTNIHLIENINDVHNLNITNNLIAVTYQTTMSIDDIQDIINEIKNKYPNVVVLESICNATKNRQKELTDTLSKFEDYPTLVIVVGDPSSNNTEMLVQRAKAFPNTYVIKVENSFDSKLDIVDKYDNIVVTSGASTPIDLVNSVIDKISLI